MEHTQKIDSSDASYTVQVDGTRCPVNDAIVIENVGDTDIVNPTLTVNGLYDWFSTERMASEITRGCATDEEKAFAIWRWVQDKRFQRSATDRSSLHPVRYFNVYGYGICGHTAAAMKALGLAAGVPSRVHEIWGHTVAEFHFDGAWHVLDGNGRVFYPKRDNRTLASVDEVGDDPFISRRSPLARFTYAYESREDNYVEHSYDEEIGRDYTMAMTLRPGERLVRHWRPTSGKFEGNQVRFEEPQTLANGEFVFEPDLEAYDVSRDAAFNVATFAQDGRRPAIHVAKKQDHTFRKPSAWTVDVRSPYAVVGGRVEASIDREGNSDRDTFTASVTPDGPEAKRGDLYAYRYYTGPRDIGLYLDPIVSTQTRVGKYGYAVHFNFGADALADPPVQTGIDRLRIVTDLQVSPHSLPALSLGENHVIYRDETVGAVKVRITHVWAERSDNTPPHSPVAPKTPRDGARVRSLIPTLSWEPVTDPDPGDSVADYHVCISLRPDCAWPVSPSLDVEVGSDSPELTVPESWLNPDTVYYWRVRARDTRGDWGPYSRVWRFST